MTVLDEAIRKARENASAAPVPAKPGSLAEAIRNAQQGKTGAKASAASGKAVPIVVAADVYTPHHGL